MIVSVDARLSLRCRACGADLEVEVATVADFCDACEVAGTVLDVRPCATCLARARTEAAAAEREAALDLAAWRRSFWTPGGAPGLDAWRKR